YQPALLTGAHWGLSALIVWQAVLTGLVYRWRHDIARPLRWRALAVAPVLMGWLFLALGYGLKDTPMAMIAIEILVFARAFFDWRTVRPWIALGLAIVIGHEVLRAQQLIPYAFLLSQPV